jgi:hypothetical protein
MSKDNIEINGITPLASYPSWLHASDSKQFYETDHICIAEQKPPAECIIQVFVHLSVCSYKIICTPVGKKLLIQGTKHIKIVYVADKPCQSVHTAHFKIPFYTFIVLGCGNYDVCDVFAAVEDIQIHSIGCKCFSISTLIFVCPRYHEDFDCHDKHDYDCTHPQQHHKHHKHDDDCDCEKTPVCYYECKKDDDFCESECHHVNIGHYANQACEFCTQKSNCPYYKTLCD